MLSVGEIRDRAIRAFGDPRNPNARSELRFGRKGSVAVRLSGEKAGLWYNFESGEGGTLLNPDELPDRADFEPRRRYRVKRDEGQAEALGRIVRGLSSPDGTPVEVYLNSRCITRWPHSIRFSSNPLAMVAIAQDLSGKVRACQRIYLNRSGQKSPIIYDGAPTPKMTHVEGDHWNEVAAVRMPGRGELILCEGVETGISIWMATGRPVAACLGNSGFDSLFVRGSRVTIARDGDEPGSPADCRIQNAIRSRKHTHRVKLASPPIGDDFNDIHQRDGLDAVASFIRAAEAQ